MGFLPISIGVMLLYDFPIGLSHTGSKEVYAVLDIFPDVLGFALILFGLIRLSKRGYECKREIVFASVMTLVSSFVFVKDVLLFRSFYSLDGENGALENTAGRYITFAQQVLILVFLVLLFRKLSSVLTDLDEPALARTNGRIPALALMDAAVYVLSFSLSFISGGLFETAARAAQLLHMLLWILIVWYGGISLLRASLRLN